MALPRFLQALKRRGAQLGQDQRASSVVTFSVAAMGLLGVTGAAIDYANLSETRAQLQSVADASALAAAKEFRLGNANTNTVLQVARNFAKGALAAQGETGAVTISPSLDTTARTVTVALSVVQPTYLMQIFGHEAVTVGASATARVVGGAPICVIGLDTEATSTILMDKSARLEAPRCSVYSNSTKPNGLSAKNSAVMRAAFICSAGGKAGAGPGSFLPQPQTDCPIISDPLASRPQPAIGSCTQTNLVLSGGEHILYPGTYCGGLTITNGAAVMMKEGTYVMRNGPLRVTGNGTLTGTYVGLFMSGAGAQVRFDGPSTISLTAPRDGAMAGMLMFEDRSSPQGQTHEILSNNARNLLGTIYLPQGRLHVAAQKPVADLSPYTIVVARMFTLSEGPTMVLNTNYSSTNIPVPDGVGPNAARTSLLR